MRVRMKEGSGNMENSEFKKRLDIFLQRRLQEEGTINAMMNMRLENYHEEKKSIELAFPVEEWQLNPAGNMHGGMISTALDITMGCVAYISGTATFTPTIQMAINFVGSLKKNDTLLIEGICDHSGSRMAQVRAIARMKSTGKVVATANGSYVMNTW